MMLLMKIPGTRAAEVVVVHGHTDTGRQRSTPLNWSSVTDSAGDYSATHQCQTTT